MSSEIKRKLKTKVLKIMSFLFLVLVICAFGFQHPLTDSLEKVPDTGKCRRQKMRVSEDEMVGWHHWCIGHELGQTLGDGEGQ